MKSFIIWLTAVIVGIATGFGISYMAEINLYVCLAVGVIVGSSVGITINIHREAEDDLPNEDESDPEERTEISQKAS